MCLWVHRLPGLSTQLVVFGPVCVCVCRWHCWLCWRSLPIQVNLNAVSEEYLIEFPDNVRDELISMNQEIWKFELKRLSEIDRDEDVQRDILAQKQYARALALGERRSETMHRIQEIQMETVQRLKEKERKWMTVVRAFLDNVQRLLEAKRKEEDEKKRKEEAMVARGKRK